MSLTDDIKAESKRIGFDLVGIAPAVSPGGFAELQVWIERGYAGAMEYIPRREAAYEHPRSVFPAVQSVVMLAVNYQTTHPGCGDISSGTASSSTQGAPSRTLGASPVASSGRVARYARSDADYHDVLRDMLRRLADYLHEQRPGCRTRGIVDTAPLLERDFARLAGLGWFGKNTMLINKRAGSWLFLAALLTDVALEPDAPHATSHCGTCTRCLDACPTNAFPEPYVLDARRCISYLTIELRDQPIPTELREPMGDWLFGCDVCQDVCPWNHKSPTTEAAAFQPRDDLRRAEAEEWLRLTPAEFDRRFGQTPLARPGRAGVLRNAAIVLGNTASTADGRAVSALTCGLNDAEPLIRGAAAWALGQFGTSECSALLLTRRHCETDPGVQQELDAAIGAASAITSHLDSPAPLPLAPYPPTPSADCKSGIALPGGDC